MRHVICTGFRSVVHADARAVRLGNSTIERWRFGCTRYCVRARHCVLSAILSVRLSVCHTRDLSPLNISCSFLKRRLRTDSDVHETKLKTITGEQWCGDKFGTWGTLRSPLLPLSFPPLFSPSFPYTASPLPCSSLPPSLTLEVSSLNPARGRPSRGERCKLYSGVRGITPDEIEFGAF